ncbi:putative protease fused with TolB domain [Vibrio nigripulchritudo SFn27]|uniref:Tricorn protease homolog n=1 Tax=Vibrio nigripulchritudo TaxID=28173 RepID=U4KGQ8_9VIBR|nr:S41 family peptidase [Vibrio nigripulchritudo]CCN81315.1 putative protease fused with TolB domain [Vibrio nigripulchritudo BLFn1]CCN86638.1 putative protease fused with TolB domain [Vibrio nigripulchritudo SFn27]CCN97115.1 putative protease fused with TolB domain [Vibrio nigripulchritudo ENn2]CCO43052.1 putative protease fused with TolB domain [Vibrio nigripulchritudo SFn135]CCO50688.1 putative protease fused with TolB domain [Vibrio nigripulchritudo Wn13]
MGQSMRFTLLAALISGAFSSAHATQMASADSSQSDAPLWLRHTALSPDGKQLAFTYKSKIYLVSSEGGEARAITSGDFYPHSLMWGPDNQTLAFAANPYGNDDVFTVSLKNGRMIRHTYHSGSDVPTSFTENGDALLFSTTRISSKEQDFYSLPEWSLSPLGNHLYRVELDSQNASATLAVPAKHAVWNRDENKLLYNSPHKDQPFRKHQRSFAVPNIWLYNKASGEHKQLTENRLAAQRPVWNSDQTGFYYLSEANGNFNVWLYDLATTEKTQITHFDTHPVRHLTVDDSDNLAFSYNGEIYTLKNGESDTRKVSINIHHFTPEPSQFIYTNKTTRFAPSEYDPGEFLLNSYGDVYAYNAETSEVKALTKTIEEEKHVNFTPDGYGAVYSALRDGKWGLYTTFSDTEEELLSDAITREETPLLVSDDHNITHPKYSPDGNKLAFVVNGRALHVLDLSESEEESVVEKVKDAMVSEDKSVDLGIELIAPDLISNFNGIDYAWSPDSSQLAVHLSPTPYSNQIHVVKADGSSPSVNVSQSGFINAMPSWSADGRVLYWATTKYGVKSVSGDDLDLTISGVFVNSRAKKDFKDDLELPEEGEQVPSYAFNENNIEYREAFHLPFSKMVLGAHLLGDNLLVVDVEPDLSGDYKTNGLIYNIRTQETYSVFSNQPEAYAVYVTENQEFAYLLTEYDIIEVDVDSGKRVRHPIDLPVEFEAEPRRIAAFDQIVRQTKEQYYRPDMGNVDWDFYSKNYRKFLPHINNDLDFAEVLSELSGELNASHTGAYGYAPETMRYDDTASLGLIFAENISGNEPTNEDSSSQGLVISEILPGGPADVEDIVLKPGDRVIAINGNPVSNLASLAKQLNNKAQVPVSVTLQRVEGRHWHQEITPIDSYEQYSIIAKRWELERRNYVLEKSDGKVGYVYLPEMNSASFEHLRAEALGRLRNTETLIIDVRFNGGGFLADTLIEFLTAQKVADLVPRKGKPASDAGRRSWLKQSVVLANASSYSEGSAFSQYYQDLKVGPIVGEPVPGTGTAVNTAGSAVYPDISYVYPFLPLKTPDGRYYENLELIPDVQAFNLPSEVENGIDSQLDAAIATALKQIQPK